MCFFNFKPSLRRRVMTLEDQVKDIQDKVTTLASQQQTAVDLTPVLDAIKVLSEKVDLVESNFEATVTDAVQAALPAA